MRYRYYFCSDHRVQLVDYLKQNNIKHTISLFNSGISFVTFNLWSTSPNFDNDLQQLRTLASHSPIVYTEYSDSDYNKARLLTLTPKKQCIDILNEDAYHYSCLRTTAYGEVVAHHEEQINLFAISREPSMKTRTAFWCEDTGFAELFTDFRVVELVKSNALNGVEFKNVILRKGSYSDKLFQMTSPNVLSRDCIRLGCGEKKEVCPVCGKEQYYIDNAYQLHLDMSKIKEASDLYVTERMWGQGLAYPLYVISQRFYQVLKQNNLIGGITLSPIVET